MSTALRFFLRPGPRLSAVPRPHSLVPAGTLLDGLVVLALHELARGEGLRLHAHILLAHRGVTRGAVRGEIRDIPQRPAVVPLPASGEHEDPDRQSSGDVRPTRHTRLLGRD